MKRLIFPGSFDPYTYGHLDLCKRAAKLCDELIVLIAINSDKTPLIPAQKRVKLIQDILNEQGLQCEVISSSEASVDVLLEKAGTAFIRGLRGAMDFDNEARLSLMNKGISESAETVFLYSAPEFIHLSSSYAKELLRLGKSLDGVCPKEVLRELAIK